MMMETRERFVASAKARLDRLNARLDQMEAKVAELKATARIEAHASVTDLKRRRDELGMKLEQAKATSADAWERLKSGIEDAFTSLEEAFDNAKSKVS